MSKKRGLSVEEKRTRMMEIFFETKDVYQLKDLEKIAPKEKGIKANQKKKNLQQSVEKAKVGRQDTEERSRLTEELAFLRKQKEQLNAELEKYKECDPDVIDEIRQSNKVAKDAVNRWTDNIFAVKSWAKKKFGFEERKLDKTFGIPEDFDYID